MINDFLKGSYAHFCPLVLRWSDSYAHIMIVMLAIVSTISIFNCLI